MHGQALPRPARSQEGRSQSAGRGRGGPRAAAPSLSPPYPPARLSPRLTTPLPASPSPAPSQGKPLAPTSCFTRAMAGFSPDRLPRERHGNERRLTQSPAASRPSEGSYRLPAPRAASLGEEVESPAGHWPPGPPPAARPTRLPALASRWCSRRTCCCCCCWACCWSRSCCWRTRSSWWRLRETGRDVGWGMAPGGGSWSFFFLALSKRPMAGRRGRGGVCVVV